MIKGKEIISLANFPQSSFDFLESAFIDERNYFADFLSVANSCGFYGDDEIAEKELQLYDLLKERISAYTRGESGSVKRSVAKKIGESVVFTLGLALKSFPARKDALIFLKGNPLGEVYLKGRAVISSKVSYARLLYRKISKKFYNSENVFWNSAFHGGIKGFFVFYTPEFFAAETHITADYPTFFDRPEACGIEFIIAYLRAIYCENEFLNAFACKNTKRLFGYLASGYESIPINLFGPVFTSAICARISGFSAKSLVGAVEAVEKLLQGGADSYKSFFGFAVGALEELGIRGETCDYAVKSIPIIFSDLQRALKFGYLDKRVMAANHCKSSRKFYVE